MPGDINIVKQLRIMSSDTGAVLKHLKALRHDVNDMRANLVRLKALNELALLDGLNINAFSELIDAYEKAIASAEQEMTTLAKSIEGNLQNRGKKE
jgi:CHAD domain-containing protein